MIACEHVEDDPFESTVTCRRHPDSHRRARRVSPGHVTAYRRAAIKASRRVRASAICAAKAAGGRSTFIRKRL